MRPSAWPHSASYKSSAPRVASRNYLVALATTPPSPAPLGPLGRSAPACQPPRSGCAAHLRSTGGVPRSLRYRSRPGAEGCMIWTRCCVGGRESRREGRRRGLPAHRFLREVDQSRLHHAVARWQLMRILEAIAVAETGGSLRNVGILTSIFHWDD
jgi:hypothetical protein